MTTKVDYTQLSGGLDLVSDAMTVRHGRMAECLNFEQVFGKQGYRRIDGYVWTQNKLSHQWMNFMGFDICSEETYATIEINKEKFLYFMRTA